MKVETEADVFAVYSIAPPDISNHICVGCALWRITVNGTVGTMLDHPTGRGAIFLGGNSAWGDWVGDILRLDSGERITRSGKTV